MQQAWFHTEPRQELHRRHNVCLPDDSSLHGQRWPDQVGGACGRHQGYVAVGAISRGQTRKSVHQLHNLQHCFNQHAKLGFQTPQTTSCLQLVCLQAFMDDAVVCTCTAGQKTAKNNPNLMLETSSKGRHVLKFHSQEDREAVVSAITNALQAETQPAVPAASAASGTASGGAAAASGAPSPSAVVQQGASQATQQLTPQQRQELLAVNR